MATEKCARYGGPLLLLCTLLSACSAAPPAPPKSLEPDRSGRISYDGYKLPKIAMGGDTYRQVRSLLDIPKPMQFGEYVWREEGIPDGEIWLRIDLSQQIVSVFRGEHEIGSAVILFGTDGKPTPSGEFRVLAKAAQHRSSLYDAEMPFMLRLTGDGIALHASTVRKGSATHGCIGLPLAFAERVFDRVKLGDLVTILPGLNGTRVRNTRVGRSARVS